jgi:hypothetical protein
MRKRDSLYPIAGRVGFVGVALLSNQAALRVILDLFFWVQVGTVGVRSPGKQPLPVVYVSFGRAAFES